MREIDHSYGADHTYTLGAVCPICGWEGTYKRAFGSPPHSSIGCPQCGCSGVKTRPHKGYYS